MVNYIFVDEQSTSAEHWDINLAYAHVSENLYPFSAVKTNNNYEKIISDANLSQYSELKIILRPIYAVYLKQKRISTAINSMWAILISKYIPNLLNIFGTELTVTYLYSIHKFFTIEPHRIKYGYSKFKITSFSRSSLAQSKKYTSLQPETLQHIIYDNSIRKMYVDIVNKLRKIVKSDIVEILMSREFESWQYIISLSMSTLKSKGQLSFVYYQHYISPSIQANELILLGYDNITINRILKFILTECDFLSGSIIMTVIHLYVINNTNINITRDLLAQLLKMLQGMFNADQLQEFFIRNYNIDSFSWSNIIYMPLYNLMVNFSSQNYSLLVNINTKLQVQHTFTANQLMFYIFSNELDDHLTWIKMIGSEISNLKTQILRVAVNEGTTKEYVPSVITELYQNSLDAILTTDGVNDIIINNGLNDQNQYVLTFTDYVGIRTSNISALLIPFYSSKNIDMLMVSGEMGSGFFNVYRQPYCKLVIVTIINDDSMINIISTPVVESNIVIDVTYQIGIFERPEGSNNKTTISINK